MICHFKYFKLHYVLNTWHHVVKLKLTKVKTSRRHSFLAEIILRGMWSISCRRLSLVLLNLTGPKAEPGCIPCDHTEWLDAHESPLSSCSVTLWWWPFLFPFPPLFLNPGLGSHAHSLSRATAHAQILHLQLSRKALPCFPSLSLGKKVQRHTWHILIEPFLHFIMEFSSETPYH